MCFKPPKPPAVPTEDPTLKAQVEQATEAERERRTMNKQARFEDQLAMWNGGYGRRSLLTGGRGGSGYAAPLMRSLLQVA